MVSMLGLYMSSKKCSAYSTVKAVVIGVAMIRRAIETIKTFTILSPYYDYLF